MAAATIPVKTLMVTNPEYRKEWIFRHNAIYYGGELFRDHKDKFLLKRKIEMSLKDGDAQYNLRKSRAQYINRFGGLVDWIKAAVFVSNPRIQAEAASEESREYWAGLPDNATGNGIDLLRLISDALLSIMLHKRAYFQVNFPEKQATMGDSEAEGARIRFWDAQYVDDWEHDHEGNLLWIRTHTSELVRPEAMAPADNVRHVWQYITKDEIAVYQYQCKKGENPTDDDVANFVPELSQVHDFGELPVYEVKVSAGQWIAERIYDVVVDLFNREASITYALDMGAYAQPVITIDRDDLDGIVASELAAIKLRIGEKYEYVTPDTSVFEALFQDAARLKNGLYEVVQSLAVNAIASQTQNARQSAAAKDLDLKPMQALLRSFALPIKEAITQLVQGVSKFRNEEHIKITISGMDGDESAVTMQDAKKVLNGEDGNGLQEERNQGRS